VANYLVTGAAGFIASRVIEMLLADGHIVYGVDNMSQAYDVRMKEYRLGRLLQLPGFHFIKLDIALKENLTQLTVFAPQIDGVINLAAVAGVRSSVEDPWGYVATNTIGALNMLEFCRQNHVKKIVLASTSSLYGNQGKPPHTEEADTNHPLQPYAASKKGAEVMGYAYHHLYEIDVTILRYFTVYGPAGRPDMVMFRLCQWIAEGREVAVTGDGEQSRGFTYLDDIARGTILGLKPLGYEVINLGGHEIASINRLIDMFEQRLGQKARIKYIPFHPADVLENVADVNKAGRLLGWEPQFGLEEGVTRLVNWYLEERVWAQDIATP
jgi:nucleoside-diphosphate-sugar epimerase